MRPGYYFGLIAFLFALFISVHLPGQTNPATSAAPQSPSSDSERICILTGLTLPISCADAQNQLSKTQEAIVHAEKAHWVNGIITANNKCGNILFACLNDYSGALYYFQAAAALYHQKGDKRNEALELEYAAKCYEKTGRHNNALEHYYKALALQPGPDIESGLWGDVGLTYNAIGDFTNALSAYIKSLQLLDNSTRAAKKCDFQDTLQRTGLLMNIGDIYQSMSQPDKAMENYQSALKTGQKINDTHIQIYAGIGIGYTYKMKKDYARSIATYTDVLNLCDPDNFADKCRVLLEMASVYLDAAQPAQAMKSATEVLQLAVAHKHDEVLPRCHTLLGRAYLAENNYEKALENLLKAQDAYHTNGELDDEKDTWEAMSLAYEKMGQSAKSLEAYRHFINIRDSIYNIKKANELTRVDLEFRYSRKQLADSLKQAAVFSKKIERQRFATYSSIAGLIMVLLLLFFIYRNYVTQKKYNVLLAKEKKTHLAHIREQDTVLTDIAHIQSHKVRGPVATILGLVQLFNYKDPADPVNKEVVDGIASTAAELDVVVREVITKENRLRMSKK